ncbi:hypothetical protein D3C80_1281910 [compost metagenome]
MGSKGVTDGEVAAEFRLIFSVMRPVGFGVRLEVSICRSVRIPWMILPSSPTA